MTCKAEHAVTVYDALHEAGARPAGLFAQTSMRIEKKFLAYGHELDTDTSPLEAGLGFAIDWETDFIGKDSLLKQRDACQRSRIVTLCLHDRSAVPLGNEPVLVDDKIVGKTTSAAFGYRIGAPIALADIASPDVWDSWSQVDVDIAGARFRADLVSGPAFDPVGQRMRPA
jgi:4-methylaminobutanoate oxidase (formaldehyde-forming)